MNRGSSPSARSRRIALNILALCGGIVVAGALGEAVVRVFDLPPHRLATLNERHYVLSDDPVLKYEYQPGFNGPFDENALTFAINAEGFRDYRYAKVKSPGTIRMLLLGDSVAAGNGVPDLSNIFPKRVERLLNNGDASPRVELLNMAVGGYNTLQEVELLRVRGLAYRPDYVVVCFCINDFAWFFDGGVFARLKQQLVEENPGRFRRIASAPDSWMTWTLRHSRLAFALYGLGSTVRDLGTHSVRVQDYEMTGGDPVRLGLELLSKLEAESGFKSILFIVPGLNRPFSSYQHERIHRRAAQIARDTMPSLTVVDLLDDLRRITDDPSPLTFDGLHLTEAGHRMIAEAMVPHLEALLAAE